MNTIMLWINRNPLASLALVLLLTAICATQLPALKLDTSADGLLVEGAEDTLFYDQVKQTFGDDENVSVIFRAADIFQTPILQSIEDLSYDLQALDGVTRIVSLTTVNNLAADEEGFLNTDTLLPYVPETAKELAQVRRNTLGNELIHGEVINAQGTVAAIQLSIKDNSGDPLFGKKLAAAIEQLLIQQRETLGPDIRLYQIGNITLGNAMMDYIFQDLLVITPLSLLVILIILFYFFRSGTTVILPLVTGLLSVVVSLGMMSVLGYAINPISLIVPSLLLIIGSTEDIHILAEYEQGIRDYKDKAIALKHMAIRSGLVIFLTTLTTFAGFITLSSNAIAIISEFGIAAGLGIVANFVITILIAPPLLAYLSVPKSFVQPEKPFLTAVADNLITISTKHRKKLLAVCLLFITGSGVSALFLQIDSNYLNFFRDDAPVRLLVDEANEDLSGANAFYVIVDSQVEGGLQQPDNLAAIAKLTDFLDQRYATVVSYDRFIRKTHKEMNGGSDDYFLVPDDADLISQYTLLMEPGTLERFADFDFQKAAIVVRLNFVGSSELNNDVAEIQAFVDRALPRHLAVTITGGSVLIAQTSDQISREILLNLALMLTVIFFVICGLFVSVKAGLLAMVPNTLPLIGAFGAMGILDIPLSTGTFPVVIIALGIAVDDTIHFMVRFSKEMQNTTDNEVAIAQTIRHELKPVLGTSLALILGFIVLTFAEFQSIAEFGLLSAVTISLALIADLLITPALLLSVPLITYWDLLSLSMSQNVIDTSPLFKGMTKGEIKRFALMGHIENEQAGELIIRQGEAGDSMLLLLKGELNILVKNAQGTNIKLATVAPGEIIGEMSLLSHDARSASVEVQSDAQFLKIDARVLDKVDHSYPRLAIKIRKNIAKILVARLKTSNQNYIGVLE
ncbi:MAG: putative RND superfamily exporter protein [Phenylobacterium sp.]|jgi:predicted RND superfamily exporter protein